MPPKSELSLPGYELVTHVQAAVGDEVTLLGTKGSCRYCHTSDSKRFRRVAHTLPEALGNKWIISLDECDDCNSLFGLYDDALAKSVGGVLTVGGTKGKNNRVRQTGRSGGPAIIAHSRTEGRRRISLRATDAPLEKHVRLDPIRNVITFTAPTGTERFVPRRAYKALVKIGLAVMPEAELNRFSRLTSWLLAQDDLDVGPLIVGLSFGSVGNAPQLANAALLRRTEPSDVLPYMILVVSIGSVCLQIALPEDVSTGGWPGPPCARPDIQWTNILGPPGRPAIHIRYGRPFHLNWCSTELEPSPVEAIETRINMITSEAQMIPLLRSEQYA